MTNSNDVEEGAVAKQAPEKKSMTNQILMYTMTILGFVPLVLFFVIPDKRIAATLAAGELPLTKKWAWQGVTYGYVFF